MSTPLTDEEVICGWMEFGEVAWLYDSARSVGGWWVREKSDIAGCVYVGPKRPRLLDLDALWEVEGKLPEDKRTAYYLSLQDFKYREDIGADEIWGWLHADAPTRIKALAQVLSGTGMEKLDAR